MMKLYPYQKKHVQRLTEILQKRRGALDLSATGTGKTICALSVAKNLRKSATVVAPLATFPGWKRAASDINIKLNIINYEMLNSLIKKNAFSVSVDPSSLLIYDEIHKTKHYRTQNAKNMLKFAKQGHKILGLSATIAHHAEHLRAANEAFRFTNDYSFSQFMYRCGYYWEQNKWGGTWLPKPQALERTKAVIEPFSSCMTLEDAKEMFKENSILVEVISSKEDKNLAKIYEQTFKALRSGDKKNGADSLTKMLRARQASEHAKLPYVVEEVERLVDEGYSVVVFCNFNDTIDALTKELVNYAPAWIRGGQEAARRENNRLAFQQNQTSVMLCNIQSGGVGLDLHDINGRPRYAIHLPPLSAVDLKQAFGRIHRAGAKSPSQQKVLFSDVPVETRIAELLRSKLHALDTLHDSEIETLGRLI